MATAKTNLWPVVIAVVLAATGRVAGFATYTGFSGAPGTHGTCALHCHGTTGGTIVTTGFPVLYVPGDTYEVKVAHSSGDPICNFNASVRIGAGAGIAGMLLSGLNTEVYEASPSESLGVHFVSASQDSGSFFWIAPNPGVGEVRFYLSGLQGASPDGPNTVLVVTASQSPGGAFEDRDRSGHALSLTLENRIVKDYLILRVSLPANRRPELRILDDAGRAKGRISIPQSDGPQVLIWAPVDLLGRRLAPGDYFASLTADGRRVARKFVVAE